MVGKYPSVPQRLLIPPSAFRSTEDVGRFVDVAAQAVSTSSCQREVVVEIFRLDSTS
jgi:hypothetical protein